MARAHNLDLIDAKSNSSTSGKKKVHAHKKKSSAYAIKIPIKIQNLDKWIKAKCLILNIPLSFSFYSTLTDGTFK